LNHYPYATGDRLEDRNTYSYSPYVGRALFVDWASQRDGALRLAHGQTTHVSPDQPTDRLLAKLLATLAAGTTRPTEWGQIDRLLQRFEVSKRLHGEYNTNWRPVAPTDYHGLERYLRFAEMMAMAYRADTRLQYLNGLLKCVDTLTSLAGELDTAQTVRLADLVRQERSHVHTLAQKLGVDISDTVARGPHAC
jgi:hypothetical protein